MNRHRTDTLIYITLFFIFMTVYGSFVQQVGPNQLSRLNLTLALANEGRLQIDTYTANAIDRAYYQGHYYTDKAPLISFLGYPVYQALRHLQGLDHVNLDTRLMLTYLLWVLNASINVPLTALLLLLFLYVGRLMRPHGVMPWAVTFVLAFGSLLFSYATMLFGHDVAAFFGFAPFVIALGVHRKTWGEPWLFLAGLLAGLGVVAEYPNGIFAIALVLYTWGTSRSPRRVGWVLLGGLGPALALATYNTLAFGHPLHFSYFYHAAPWGAEHRQGLFGVRWPTPYHFYQILFSPKGLFFLMPVALLAPVAYLAMWRDRRWRAEFWLSLLIPATLLLLNAGYFYTLGGSSPGPRFLVPTFPYLFLPYVFLNTRWRWPLIGLGLVSAFFQLAIVLTNPLVGRYADPLLQYWLPHLWTPQVKAALVIRQRFGVPYRFALLFLLLWMALGPVLVWVQERLHAPWRSRIMRAAFAVTVIVYLLVAFPVDVRHPTQVPPLYRLPSPPVRDNPPPLPGS